ncbi:MFS transporter, partial [Escherichia coli]
ALELAPKKAAGTAAGFTGLFGYLGGSVAASAIVGYTVDFLLPNKLLWYIAIANVFVYLLRYGILDWSPTYLKEVKHFALDKSSWAYFFYEYAGIPGTLLCGWMSDKVFRGNRGATGVFFMTLVTIATIVYWMNPAGNPNVDMICMIVIGFLIYGPVMLIGLH